ncbi:MAG TPA: hypothetical protein VK821_21180 [Dehalococcoidia bacterium]|nr:hypothetical protein [Dehalococcoidia bacterium]
MRQPGVEQWRIETTSYIYSFQLDAGRELLAYHWHDEPDAHSRGPHARLKQASGVTFPALQKAHVPTGVVKPEDIVLLALDGLRVGWRREDWQAILGA